MKADAYFKRPDIGSSLLARFIDHPDKAAKEPKPKSCMEKGNIYEARLQQEIEGSKVFSGKYFKSSVENFPDSKCHKNIQEILESKNVKKAVKSGYIYNKPDKHGDSKLSGHHKARHQILDEIAEHGYKKHPVPAGVSRDLEEMMTNFKLATFQGANLFQSLKALKAKFQVPYFWKHENGAYCRAKWDIVVIYTIKKIKYGLVFDIKATENWPSFVQNWRKNYIWQNIHYLDGFRRWCLENGVIPPDRMWYLVAESSEPWLVNKWALSPQDLDDLRPEYEGHLARCQAWIDAGKPRIGEREEKTVNRWGREVSEETF